jgi:hypothetical protein
MLEVSENFSPCEKGSILYQARRLERLMAIPQEKVFPKVTIHTTRFKTADLSRHEYYAKFRYLRLCEAINLC